MDDSISRFWDNYISKTVTCNIPEHAQRILYTEIIKPKWAEEFSRHTWMHDGREFGTERGTLARIPDATVSHWITEYIHVFCRYCNHPWVSLYGPAFGCSNLIRQICRASTRLFKFNPIEFSPAFAGMTRKGTAVGFIRLQLADKLGWFMPYTG